MELRTGRVLWDMVGGPMPRGLLGVGSGDVAIEHGRRVLYLGGYSTDLRNRLYVATTDSSGPLARATWRIDKTDRGRARPLVADPPRTAWDGGGLHTPSYLGASDDASPRIYYAGRSGRRHVGPASRYAIGVLEHDGTTWQRREAPLIRGDETRPSVLEPRVVREGGRYVMWFLATPHEVAPGEQPDYELRSTTSADGLTDWSEPTVFATTREGFFDVALSRSDEGWTMVLAAGTNLHRTRPYPP